jgi:hypothetical protein
VIGKQVGVAHIAAERVHGPVTRGVRDFEERRALAGGGGAETSAKRMRGVLRRLKSDRRCLRFDDRGDPAPTGSRRAPCRPSERSPATSRRPGARFRIARLTRSPPTGFSEQCQLVTEHIAGCAPPIAFITVAIPSHCPPRLLPSSVRTARCMWASGTRDQGSRSLRACQTPHRDRVARRKGHLERFISFRSRAFRSFSLRRAPHGSVGKND